MGCIYMYTNKINGMRYIGQTICRLKKRHHEHLHRDNSYIDRALRKYGEENFILEILEDNIDDTDILNEREEYWINQYDTFNNGYNLTKGGSGSPSFNQEVAMSIIADLKNTKLTMLEIGEKYQCSIYTISDINTGNTCHQKDVQYPVRKHKSTQKYHQEELDIVISFLKDTDYSYAKISEITGLKFSYINDVNRGRVAGDYHGINIPIRKYKYDKSNMTYDLALSIIEYLKKDYSAEQISEIFCIPAYSVGQLNRGKMSICKILDEEFPIQKRPHRNKECAQKMLAKLSSTEVLEIAELLVNTSLSLEEIARRYSVEKTSINRINQKKTWKNVLKDYEAPIRTNPRNKIAQ